MQTNKHVLNGYSINIGANKILPVKWDVNYHSPQLHIINRELVEQNFQSLFRRYKITRYDHDYMWCNKNVKRRNDCFEYLRFSHSTIISRQLVNLVKIVTTSQTQTKVSAKNGVCCTLLAFPKVHYQYPIKGGVLIPLRTKENKNLETEFLTSK